MSRSDGVIEVVCKHKGQSHDPVQRAAAMVQAAAVFQLCAFQRGISRETGHPWEPGFARAIQAASGPGANLFCDEYDYDRCACGEHSSAWIHNKDWKPPEKKE